MSTPTPTVPSGASAQAQVAKPGSYEAAFEKAQALANSLGREVGIEKANEFGRIVYLVKHLPRPENRCGWELRCEVVCPVTSHLNPA